MDIETGNNVQAVVAYFKVLFPQLRRGTDKNLLERITVLQTEKGAETSRSAARANNNMERKQARLHHSSSESTNICSYMLTDDCYPSGVA
jgi:hypothetical protein